MALSARNVRLVSAQYTSGQLADGDGLEGDADCDQPRLLNNKPRINRHGITKRDLSL